MTNNLQRARELLAQTLGRAADHCDVEGIAALIAEQLDEAQKREREACANLAAKLADGSDRSKPLTSYAEGRADGANAVAVRIRARSQEGQG